MSTTSQSIPIVLFVFLALLLAILCSALHKKLKIPVPSSLLVCGIIIRSISDGFGLSKLATTIDNISPETILLVIIPPLIFQGAISTDWHIFKKELFQIIPMATSVVVVSSLIQSVMIKLILGYDLTWNQSVLLGILLCATDHAMTRDIMKSIHMDSNFNALVSGETILNQVTVITVFVILNNSPQALTEFGPSLLLFIKKTSVGFFVGLGFSWAMGRAVRRIVNDYVQETNLTLTTTYLLFWVVEKSLSCSGVMAVVTYGLYMSAYGKTLISPTVEKKLMYLWEVISLGSESLVFLMGGMVLGREFIQPNSLSITDLYKLILIYLSQLLVRSVVVFAHYPILLKFGFGINFNKIVILCLGGIKGVISTALAVIAANSISYDKAFRALVLYLTIGVTFLTIVVNPLLLRLAHKILRIVHISEVQENLLLRVTSRILKKTYEKLEKLEKSKEFNLVKWEDVEEIAGPRELVVAIMNRSIIGRQILKDNPNANSQMLISRYCDFVEINESTLLLEMRRRFYNALKGIYWHEFESGQCLGQTSLILINVTSVLQHKDNEPIQDWKYIESEIYSKHLNACFVNLFENPFTSCVFGTVASGLIVKIYDAASTFLKAHRKVRKLFECMEIDQSVLQQILDESDKQQDLCTTFLNEKIIDNYPEVISEVQSKMACFALLISQRKLISKIFQQGVIKNLEYRYLVTAIDSNVKTLTFLSTPKVPQLKKVLKKRFIKASASEISYLMSAITEIHLKPGEIIYEENQESSGAYLILTGKVHESSSWIDQELSINSILGAQHFLPGLDHVNTTTAVTLTVVTAVHLPNNMIGFECFEEELYKEAAEEYLILNKEKFSIKGAENDHIIFVVGRSYVKRVYVGSMISLRRGGIVLKGRIRNDKPCFSLLRPTKKRIESIDDAIILIFPPHFSRALRNNRNCTDALAEFYIKNKKKSLFPKENLLLKLSSKRKDSKIYKKLKEYAKKNLSIDSLDKMLNL